MNLLTISDRPEDIEFCKKVAQNARFQFFQETVPAQITVFLEKHKETVVFWDVDHENSEKPGLANSSYSISQRFVHCGVSQDKVFALCTQPVSKLAHLANIRSFGFQILRQYDDAGAEILGYIVQACYDPEPFGVSKFIPSGTPIHKLSIKESKQRGPLATAIENIFIKKELHPQLCSLIAQSTDELLMNAIFDAPLDKNQFPYRRATPRNEAFNLSEKEWVTMELTQTPNYLIVCVADSFGSLPKDVAIDFLKKDYENQKYKLDRGTKGAGLGVYGMMQAGESLLFLSRPGHRTEVMIFVPFVKNMRAFRTSFSFFGFIFT